MAGHLSSKPRSGETPLAEGPRNCGQSAPASCGWTLVGLKMQSVSANPANSRNDSIIGFEQEETELTEK